MVDFFIQLAVVLGAIFIGIKQKGIGIGIMSCLGLLLLVVGFGMSLGTPSFKVVLMIMAATIMSAMLEVAGTFDLLVSWAGKLLMRYPGYVTWLSAFLSYGCVFLVGTSHIIYPLFPIIARMAKRSGTPAVRPLVASVIASQQAILASPLSAATGILLTVFKGFGFRELVMVFLPATLVGTCMATWVANRLGSPVGFCSLVGGEEEGDFDRKMALRCLCIFSLGVLGMVLVHFWLGERVDVVYFNALVLLSIAGCIAFFVDRERVLQTRVFKVGMQAVIVLLGVSWLSNSFFEYHKATIQRWLSCLVFPWQWGLLLFVMTVVTSSQSATLQMMLPLGLLGMDPWTLLFLVPAANSFYVLPSYPTMVAARGFDDGRTIKVGRWVVNHSFLLAGLVGTLGTCGITKVIIYCFFP